ncbi:MAG: hypothetical protein O2954_13965 [bacterium]|nr:hypothetical protein [bacterium]
MDEQHQNSKRAYEVSDAKIGIPVISGIVLLVLVVVFVALMAGMFDLLAYFHAQQDTTPPPMAEFRPSPPGPRLQIDPPQALKTMRKTETELLTEYGWADRENNKVRIPLENAIDLLAARGLPTRKEALK